MKYWYQQPPTELSGYVRTILILDGAGQNDGTELPMVTKGMQSFICISEKDKTGKQTTQLTLFGKPAPEETWNADTNTNVIACFFHPFALACMFNMAASKLNNHPVALNNWNAHKTNALNIQLAHTTTISEKTAT